MDHTAQEILHRTLIAFHRLKSELDQELNEEKTSKVKLFKFVFKHMGELLTILLPHISNMKEALTTAVKEEALEMLQRANLLLRDFYVFADTLETEFFLKEGYITRKLNIGDISLHALLNDMHQAIEQAGYEFKSEERFPYSVTLQEDRVKRLEKLEKLEKQSVLLREAGGEVKKTHVAIQNSIASKAMLKKRLKQQSSVQEDSAAGVGSNRDDETELSRRNAALGERALLLDAHEDQKGAIIVLLENRIEQLKCARAERFVMSSRLNHENKIFGLTLLCDLYRKSGYRIEDALKEIQIKYSGVYKQLESDESQLIQQTKTMDCSIEKAQRGRKLIDFMSKQIKPNVTFDIAFQKMNIRMSDLENELQSACCFSRVKKEKIHLLNSLKDNLRTKSFHESVNLVRKENIKNYHLFYEGRTGKLLREIENSSYSQDEMSHRIDLEIARLRKEKRSVTFFAERRGKAVQERMDALEALKTNNFDIEALGDENQKALLRRYEQRLLEDLSTWRQYHITTVTASPL